MTMVIRGGDQHRAALEKLCEEPRQDHRIGNVGDGEFVEAEQDGFVMQRGGNRWHGVGLARLAILELLAMGMDAATWLAQRNAMGVTGDSQLVGTGSGTYSIESRARLTDGREASLRTVVRAGANPVPGSAYTLLRWEEGASPQ